MVKKRKLSPGATQTIRRADLVHLKGTVLRRTDYMTRLPEHIDSAKRTTKTQGPEGNEYSLSSLTTLQSAP